MKLSKKLYSSLTDPSKKTSHLSSAVQSNSLIKPTLKHLAPLTSFSNAPIKLGFKNQQYYNPKTGDYFINIDLYPIGTQTIKPLDLICCVDVSGSMDNPATHSYDVECSKFSRWDLVKHSTKTIIHCLRPIDTFSLITFSDRASLRAPRSNMDAKAKTALLSGLDRVSINGGTNLWDGVNTSLNGVKSSDANKFVLILSDGDSNIDPPRGLLSELDEHVKQKPLLSTIDMFGYGYDLDSTLLRSIATVGTGLFAHIPDHRMCNTVFINYLANCFSTAINKTKIVNINSKGFPNLKILDPTIGTIPWSGSKNIILQTQIDPHSNFEINMDFEYDGQQISYRIDKVQPQTFLQDSDISYDLLRLTLLSIIEDGLNTSNHAETLVKLEQVYNMLPPKFKILADNIQHPDNNFGQIYKAFSNKEWFARWGVHYLKYFIQSHKLQVCSNFKDSSLQRYANPLFTEIRTEIEDIFMSIPEPQPSLSSTPFAGNFQQSFYDHDDPCVAGTNTVQVVGSDVPTKYVKDLKACDVILNSDGSTSKIKCIMKSRVKQGKSNLYNVNGLLITAYHPVRIEGKWQFPKDVTSVSESECDYVYSFVLENGEFLTVSGVDVASLGHGNTTDTVLKHEFWGEKVISHMQTLKGWHEGLVVVENYRPHLDQNGLVIGFDI